MDAPETQGLCAKLWCKGMITRAPEIRDSASWYDATVWWCSGTQKVTGPDDRPVGPDDCVNGRGCWRDRHPA